MHFPLVVTWFVPRGSFLIKMVLKPWHSFSNAALDPVCIIILLLTTYTTYFSFLSFSNAGSKERRNYFKPNSHSWLMVTVKWVETLVNCLKIPTSGHKLIENAKNVEFWRFFENLKHAIKQCYQTGQFNKTKKCWKMPQISPKSKVFYCFWGRWLGPSLSVPLNIRRGCCCFFEFLWSDVPADWLAYCCWRFSPTSFSRTVFPSSSLPRSESRLFSRLQNSKTNTKGLLN